MLTARRLRPRGATCRDRRAERRAAAEGTDAGFTLIELMVVLLIMAILMGIALPTFVGVRIGAQFRSTQSDLTNAVISARAIFADDGDYPGSTTMVSELGAAEPELTFITGSTHDTTYTEPHTVSLLVSPNEGWILVVTEQSNDGRCWYAESNDEPAGENSTDGLSTSLYDSAPGVWFAGSATGSWTYCNAAIVRPLLGGWQQTFPSPTT